MIARLAGALLRAFLVVLMISTPSLLLPGTTIDGAQIITLVAIFAAMLTIFEYASTYPGLVEFRDAPPFNRVRFFSLFITVFCLTMICQGEIAPSTISEIIRAVGALIGHVIDFPYSPVRLVVLMLPEDATVEQINLLRATAGLSYLISLVTLATFIIILRVQGWPLKTGAFNVWVNLPTFDPTAGGDVVTRLERDARVNIVLGFLLPFVVPAIIDAAGSLTSSVSLDNYHTLIWTVAAWAFLPASLFLRGIAMGRIAKMITAKRRESSAAEQGDLLPA